MNPAELTQSLKSAARQYGFQLAGACRAVTPVGFHHLLRWLDSGAHGEMLYIPKRLNAYKHPQAVLADVKSILTLAMDYTGQPPTAREPGYGRVARYAQGPADYHDVVHERLQRLGERFESLSPGSAWRGVVDTAPLLEREFASLSGIGWQAKNTMLINPHRGSWFFLAALLVDVELAYDEPLTSDHCGTCRACLDACPTQAFTAPRVLDARRCISYLTIESRGAIPQELRPSIGDWVFGCDICQEVCPWNRFADPCTEPALTDGPWKSGLDLESLLSLDEPEFRRRYKATVFWRPRRRGMLRNAAIVLGNERAPRSLPILIRALDDADPIVRGAVVWALGQYEAAEARQALQSKLALESDTSVLAELHSALSS